jgi:hypothetical protein
VFEYRIVKSSTHTGLEKEVNKGATDVGAKLGTRSLDLEELGQVGSTRSTTSWEE